MLLGMSKATEFSDVYGLDPEVRFRDHSVSVMHVECLALQLLGLVPQPVKAFIMCFPITPDLEKAQKADNERITKDGQHPLDPSLVFIKQTVSA